MVVVGSNGVHPLILLQKIVVDIGVIIRIAVQSTAVIEDLHGVQAFILHVIFIALQGPYRMIVGCEETLLPEFPDHLVDAFRGIDPLKVRLILVEGYPGVRLRIVVFGPMPTGLGYILRIQGDKADVTLLGLKEIRFSLLAEGIFHAGQCHEILVRQIVVGHHDLMVSIGNHGIAVIHIQFFNFLRGQFTVGDSGVAVKIGLVELAVFRQQIFTHNTFLHYSANSSSVK